jgi:hypothetical protein
MYNGRSDHRPDREVEAARVEQCQQVVLSAGEPEVRGVVSMPINRLFYNLHCPIS